LKVVDFGPLQLVPGQVDIDPGDWTDACGTNAECKDSGKYASPPDDTPFIQWSANGAIHYQGEGINSFVKYLVVERTHIKILPCQILSDTGHGATYGGGCLGSFLRIAEDSFQDTWRRQYLLMLFPASLIDNQIRQ
jgi:hypothetical protein